jgi:hypothetical protein
MGQRKKESKSSLMIGEREQLDLCDSVSVITLEIWNQYEVAILSFFGLFDYQITSGQDLRSRYIKFGRFPIRETKQKPLNY